MLARLLPHLQTGVWTWPIFLLRHLLLLTIGGCNDNDDNDDLYIKGAVSNEKADSPSYLFCHGGW